MDKILILLYHQILSKEDNLLKFKAADKVYLLKEEDFSKQLDYLYSNGWHALSLIQLVDYLQNKIPFPEKSLIISFDDGNSSDYTLAFPLLKKYDFKAIFFLTTDFIGKHGYLRKSQILEMSREGMEFGSHGKTHKFLPALNEEELKIELKESKEVLEDITGKEVNLLSLPGGYFSPRVKRVAQELKFKGVCTSDFGWNESGTEPFELKRVSLRYGDSLPYFISLLNLNENLYFKKKLKAKALGLLKTLLGSNNYFKLWNIYQKILQRY